MDSLHRFSIERLTSPSHVTSNKGHSTTWSDIHTSSIYPMPTYGQTASVADRSYPWNPSYSSQNSDVISKSFDERGSVHTNDSSYQTAKTDGQPINQELESPNSSKVSARSIDSYGTGSCTNQPSKTVCEFETLQVQNGGHFNAERCSPEEEPILDVVEDDKSEDCDKAPSEGQEEIDASGKPEHSYIALISMSILASPEKKLVLSDIYQYIMDNFQYYNNQERAWRNSIRHNLSLNECFIKAGRAENGKGNYWAIHPACIEDFSKGDYRRRHARRRARGGPYSDINVSSLPYNYRCNLGYVPMTPSTAIGYPYPLSYLHGLPNCPTPPTALLRGREQINKSTAPSISISPTMPSATTNNDRNHVAMFTAKDNQAGQELKHLGALSSSVPSLSSSKATGLLPQSYLPNVLSPSLRYSPYGFPFF